MFRSKAVLFVLVSLVVTARQGRPPAGEWRRTGGDQGNTRYSPLDQINAGNVKDLKIAWVWRGDNFGSQPEYKNETTPLMIDGVLYFTAGDRRSVVAADPGTGETLWVWRLDEGGRTDGVRKNSRGVAYWSDGQQSRIFTVTPGYQLAAMDAKTGRPIASFGKDGVVDLTKEVEKDANFNPLVGHLMNTSPPLVSGNIVVIPTSLENGRLPKSQKFPKGDIMAFDARTGKKVWVFHTIPRPGEFGADTWGNNSNVFSGNTGAWAPFSVDEELGILYLPVEGATGDQFGGQRPGDNLFSSSLVAVDIKTGKRLWHQQIVRHDIWDYDPPSAPILADITVDGKRIKAVVQLTKMAFAYVFDRTNGNPVWPIQDRAVPQSDVPGEKTSTMQRFPTKPPAFDRQGMTRDDVIDFTPQVKEMALKAIEGYRLGPVFTPPSIVDTLNGQKGTLTFPGSGGANWEGGAFDPETGYLYVASATRTDTAVYGVTKPQQGETDLTMIGTASIAPTIQGLPIVKPPWNRITAIDRNKGTQAWQVVNGDTPPAVKNHPLLRGVTLPKTGSTGRAALLLVTKTLVFAGEGYNGQPFFRALDKKTGRTIFEMELPGNETGLPMTYIQNGRQFIVVATGSRGAVPELVALALPEKRSR